MGVRVAILLLVLAVARASAEPAACDAACKRRCTRLDLSACERGCDDDDAVSCFFAGDIYEGGRGLPVDRTRAEARYDRACKRGHEASCNRSGVMKQDDRAAADGDAPIDPLAERCTAGRGDACHELAVAAHPDEDVIRRFTLEKRACELGSAAGCTAIGKMYAKGVNTRPDPTTAKDYFVKACSGNDADGCFQLGWLYEAGNGIAADAAKAAELYGRACGHDADVGCALLGRLYADGRGVKRDVAHANELFARACDHDRMYGCHELGVSYRDGRGFKRDDKRAAQLFERACGIDDADGCRDLGLAYRDGSGVEHDDGVALIAFKRACTQHVGCFEAAEMFAAGRGARKDPAAARADYLDACDLGDKRACSHVDNP